VEPLVVINVAVLSPGLVKQEDQLRRLRSRRVNRYFKPVHPVFPAVTSPVQASLTTGLRPAKHGIIGNGWHDRERLAVDFWSQSARLVQAPRSWQQVKAENPDFTAAVLCWQQIMGCGADLVLTPAPVHKHDGSMISACYSQPAGLYSRLAEKHGPFDIIVDDGGHHVHQQITSFEHLWPHLNDKGYYIVEDTHTSYWPGFGGGFREEKSFIEYAKRLIDKMHSWYTDQDDIFPFDEWARQLQGVRFYDSVTVIEKDLKSEPPLLIGSTNGEITGSRRSLQVRGRRSVFQGRDGT